MIAFSTMTMILFSKEPHISADKTALSQNNMWSVLTLDCIWAIELFLCLHPMGPKQW